MCMCGLLRQAQCRSSIINYHIVDLRTYNKGVRTYRSPVCYVQCHTLLSGHLSFDVPNWWQIELILWLHGIIQVLLYAF